MRLFTITLEELARNDPSSIVPPGLAHLPSCPGTSLGRMTAAKTRARLVAIAATRLEADRSRLDSAAIRHAERSREQRSHFLDRFLAPIREARLDARDHFLQEALLFGLRHGIVPPGLAHLPLCPGTSLGRMTTAKTRARLVTIAATRLEANRSRLGSAAIRHAERSREQRSHFLDRFLAPIREARLDARDHSPLRGLRSTGAASTQPRSGTLSAAESSARISLIDSLRQSGKRGLMRAITSFRKHCFSDSGTVRKVVPSGRFISDAT